MSGIRLNSKYHEKRSKLFCFVVWNNALQLFIWLITLKTYSMSWKCDKSELPANIMMCLPFHPTSTSEIYFIFMTGNTEWKRRRKFPSEDYGNYRVNMTAIPNGDPTGFFSTMKLGLYLMKSIVKWHLISLDTYHFTM